MKTLLQILFLLLFTTNCAAPDAAPEIKEEAKSFFKTIVKTYFDKDCDKLYSLFNDKVTIIESYEDNVFSSKEMVEDRKACEKFDDCTEGLSSFQQYIDDYKIIVLDKNEYTSKNNDSVTKMITAEQTGNGEIYEILQEHNKHYTDFDYLVFGNIHKTNSNKNLSRGLFSLVVRKTKNGWKIFGTER